jgi:hypothetical protein
MKIDRPAFKHCFIGETSLLTAYCAYFIHSHELVLWTFFIWIFNPLNLDL